MDNSGESLGNSRRNDSTTEEAVALVKKHLSKSGSKVIDHHFESLSIEETGFLSSQVILSVKVLQKNGDIKILSFFIKTRKPNFSPFEDCVFKKECRFFRDVMPQLMDKYNSEPWAASCYLNQDSMIILENLKSQGFKMISKSLTADQLRASVSTIAHYHACSMTLEAKLGTSLKDVFPGLSKDNIIINDDENSWKWLRTGINVAEVIAEKLGLDPKYISRAYDLMFEKIQPKAAEHGNVLCHNDLWLRNVMFRETNGQTDCRLIDFQNVSYASLAVDLLQFLHLNVAKDLRNELEGELIELYQKVLEDHLKEAGLDGEVISLQGIHKLLDDKRVYGFVVAVYNLPVLLMNEDMIREFVKDDETHYKYKYVSRVEPVLNAMKIDRDYCFRMEESVTELIDYMKELQ